MYSFFILGQIPGTNITISFTMWLQLSLVIIAALTWVVVRRRKAAIAEYLQPTIANDEAATAR